MHIHTYIYIYIHIYTHININICRDTCALNATSLPELSFDFSLHVSHINAKYRNPHLIPARFSQPKLMTYRQRGPTIKKQNLKLKIYSSLFAHTTFPNAKVNESTGGKIREKNPSRRRKNCKTKLHKVK